MLDYEHEMYSKTLYIGFRRVDAVCVFRRDAGIPWHMLLIYCSSCRQMAEQLSE